MSATTLRLFLAIVFFVHENNYFGWNAVPHSPEELLADGIVVLLTSMAVRERKEHRGGGV